MSHSAHAKSRITFLLNCTHVLMPPAWQKFQPGFLPFRKYRGLSTRFTAEFHMLSRYGIQKDGALSIWF